jgi:hypothetical protein
MALRKGTTLASWALAALLTLLTTIPASARGSVTPSFGDGRLVLVGEGYRTGERVEITVRAGGRSHQFTATADGQGRFRLDTGLQVPPFSSVEIEARDEQGLTQATITSAPGSPSGSGGGMPLPPAPSTGAPPAVSPASPIGIPSQLPRVGSPGNQGLLLVVGVAGALLAGLGLILRPRARRSRQ